MCGLHASDGPVKVKGARAAPSVRSFLFAKHARYNSTTVQLASDIKSQQEPTRANKSLTANSSTGDLRYSTSVQYNWFALTVNRCTTLDGLIRKKTHQTAQPIHLF